ncbi:AMP-dependent synthetase [Desulfonema ishimotonii]|uniref:AMP-dependent synthetase n=1 Tax=Desulfonema ishimotonii TaxID=45657 RepID=A0A401FQE3_9BACT|nr:AMP-binding protein [Desulfonema ishimotonii]GBC59203.1 AMP-dependent synthetase [Desulfonema ishimotonii]
MEKIWMKNWPPGIPRTLKFTGGEVPIHEYLRIRAREMPDKAAIIFYGREISYRELDTASDRFAGYLLEQGVWTGDRVAVFMGNCPQYMVAHFGIQKIGAVVCPCSPLFKEMELEHELTDAGAEILVAWAHLMPVVSSVRERTGLRNIVATHLGDYLPDAPALPLPDIMKHLPAAGAVAGADDFLSVVSGGKTDLPPVDIDVRNDIGLLQYTGGTTGLPKGCMLTHYAALFKTASVCAVTEMKAEDVCLVTMPVFHIAGMLAGMNSCIYAGATQVLMTLFDAEAAMTAIEQYGISFWYSAVPMNVAIMAHPEVGNYDLSSLRLCLTSSFGIQLSEEIAKQWEARTGGGLLIEGAYGLSETHTADTFMPRHRIRYGTVGIPGFEQEFRIVEMTDRTREVPIGEQGEIAVKNPAVFKGYWNQPEISKGTLVDGWVYTGDIGKFDEEGFLYLLGRQKEMIKVSGFSVFPEEVELFLNRHPAIAQAAVIGVPDPKKGEVVKAFIVPYPGQDVSADEIRQWARGNMSSYKCPVYVEFRESLPTLGTGKLLRRVLKEQ